LRAADLPAAHHMKSEPDTSRALLCITPSFIAAAQTTLVHRQQTESIGAWLNTATFPR
jgi:hypothetical protein